LETSSDKSLHFVCCAPDGYCVLLQGCRVPWRSREVGGLWGPSSSSDDQGGSCQVQNDGGGTAGFQATSLSTAAPGMCQNPMFLLRTAKTVLLLFSVKKYVKCAANCCR